MTEEVLKPYMYMCDDDPGGSLEVGAYHCNAIISYLLLITLSLTSNIKCIKFA